MSQNPNQNVVWFDLPTRNLDRAIAFYSAVLAKKVEKQEVPGMSLGILPHDDNNIGGCLFHKPDEPPGVHGPLLYFNASGRLDAAIAAVEMHGGRILQAKHSIGPHGWRAVVLDSEGNRIALHSHSG